jgi:hypothetical protein
VTCFSLENSRCGGTFWEQNWRVVDKPKTEKYFISFQRLPIAESLPDRLSCKTKNIDETRLEFEIENGFRRNPIKIKG